MAMKKDSKICYIVIFFSLLLYNIFSNKDVLADIICVNPIDPTCYKSIQEGINAASGGDTVQVSSGIYVEQVTLKSGIILKGENRETTSIWNNNDTVVGQGITNAVIQGFTITSAAGNGIKLHTCTVNIFDNILEDCADSGIITDAGNTSKTYYIDIEKNIIKNNSTGISYMANNRYAGLIGYIWNNLIYDNNDTGIIVGGKENSRPKIVNNVIFDNVGDGVRTEVTNGGSPYISNNIIMNNDGYGIINTTMTPTVAFNDVYNNTMGNYDNVIIGPGSISVDPLFIDAINGDFHLSNSSPVIDAGNSVNAPPDDIDGDVRPQGTNYDMGVDEISSSPPPQKCECDLDNDGDCDMSDYFLFGLDWGRTDCPQ
jgi:hypothetical protein